MTHDEIIEMAKQAGFQHPDAVGQCEDFAYFELETFAKLVAAKEKKACAKVCDDLYAEDESVSVGECVAAILARGEQA